MSFPEHQPDKPMQKPTLPKFMLSAKLVGVAVINCLLATLAHAAQPSISVNFEGGNAAGAPTLLAPADVAGVVPLANWNNINGNTVVNAPLADSNGTPTTVTISFTADESWGSGTGTSTPNHALFNGYLGPSNDGNYRPIFLNNVPPGAYKLIIYTLRDASGAGEGFTINGNTNTTLHVNSQGFEDFNLNPVFVRGTSTDPGARQLCNYVQFDLVAPVNGTITIDARSESFRAPVNGLQLIALPEVAQLGVSFSGRTGDNVPGPLLAPETSAGYLVQSNWNNIDNSSVFSGVSGPLNTSNGTPTLVTLTYDANDSWNNDGPTGTGDEQLFKGISKANGGDRLNTYTFNNVTPGVYDVIVYLNVNGDGRIGDIACGGTTYYFTSQHTFAGSFIQVTNKNPLGTRDTGNFVRFYGVPADGLNRIPVTFINRGDADGIGIAGFQLLPVPTVATIAASFTGRDDGNDAGYSLAPATAAGLIVQSNWNNIANGPAPHNGVTGPLVDANAGITQVTLTYDANDAWHNDGATGTGDQQMFKGISKANGVDRLNTYTFNNVRPGVYDLIAYLNVNGDGRIGDISCNGVTYYFTSQHSFAGSFIQTASTDSGTRPVGNYARFYGITVSEASSQIPLTFVNRGDPDGIGISGFQLIRVFGPSLIAANTVGNPYLVRATFSGAMNATALNPANYTLDNGVTVSAVEFEGPGSNVVRLTTSAMTVGVQYTLTVANAQDSTGLAVSPNPSTIQFTYGSEFERGGLTMKRYDGDGNLVNIKAKIANCVTPNRYNPNIASMIYGTNPSYNNDAADGNTENFGTQLYGLFVPPVSGNYQFALASDDSSELYLSTDENPANKVLLTSEIGCCTPFSAHTTAMISLVAGRSYYMQVIHQEGGGGDHVEVAIRYPGAPAIVDGDLNQVIPRSLFSTNYSYGCPPTAFFKTIGPVFFTQDLTPTNIIENTPFAYRVEFDGTPTYSVQWYSNNVPVTGLTSGSHSELPFTVRAANQGDTFYAVVNNNFSSATSAVVTLSVTLAPQMLAASSRNDPANNIYVLWSKDMGAAAAVPGSYTVDNGVTVSTAEFHNGDPRLIRLGVSALTPGVTYAVTATGVTDPDSNIMNPNPTVRSFTHLLGINPPQGLSMKRFDGSGDFTIIRNKILACAPPQRESTTMPDFEYAVSDPAMTFEQGNLFGDPNTDNYGTWIYGLFVPPTTGNYQFIIASDDHGELFLSTDSSPANKVLISSVAAWNGHRTYVTQSDPGSSLPVPSGMIPLVAGKRYYMEAIVQEGGGGDHVSVAMRTPGGPAIVNGQLPIGRELFATNYSIGCPPSVFFNNLGPVVILEQPVSANVIELSTTTFRVLLDGSPDYTYQWRSNGVPVPGANGPSYTFNPLRYANGAIYTVVAANGFSSVTSAPAALTVISDEIPPTVTQVLGAPSRTVVGIIFSEALTLLQATNPANYTITNSAGAVLAHSVSVLPEVSPDGKSVTLRTAPQTSGEQYGIVLNNLTDRAGVPNVITPNPTVVLFTASDLFYAPGAVVFRAYPTGGGNAIAELTNHPSYLNNQPDFEAVITAMNSRLAPAPYNNNGRENYGGGIIGHFIPPTSGNWIFYVSSDDDGLLLMNTNGPNSNGKSPVRFAPGCCRALSAGSDPTPPISLLAGQAYYIEALFKEGGGGDYVEVAARLQGSSDALVVIGSANLAFASKLTITQNPTNLTVVEGKNATFNTTVTVAGAGVGSQRYQWQRSEDGSGASFTNIPGATAAGYTFRAFETDDQIQFRVVAYLPGLQTNVSSAAVLTVLNDDITPVLLSARVGEIANQIVLTYSEAIDPNAASDPSSFYLLDPSFNPGPGVVIRAVNGPIITLTLDGPIPPNTFYTLYGDGQTDEFGNVTDPFTTESPIFGYQPFGLIHRYSFRNVAGPAAGSNIIDSVGGAHGVVLGADVNFTGERLTLGGGASATAGYADLPNRLLSTNGAANGGSGQFSVEAWVKVTGVRSWARIFDFGNATTGELTGPGGGGDGDDYFFYSASVANNTALHQLEVREVDPDPDGSTLNIATSVQLASTNFNKELYFVITWDEATGQLRAYENGIQVGSLSTIVPMHKINDVNVWLGRSQWSGDANMQGEFDEFRMYNRILTPGEMAFNSTVGPNNDFGTPLAVRIVVQTNVMLEGSSQQARIFADFNSISNVDLTVTRSFSFLSDDPSLVTISANSVLSAGVSVSGTANLTASFAGVDATPVPITVLEDTFPPTVLSARVDETRTIIQLIYSEPMDPNVGTDPSNFSLNTGDPGVVARVVNGSSIFLTLAAPLSPNTHYLVTGEGQVDLFGNPTAPVSTVTPVFVYQPFGLTHRYSFRNAAGTAGGATVIDSVGNANGTVLGAGANFTGERVTLAGGPSATAGYVDLPNGLLSTNAAANGGSGKITLEGWARVTGNQNWSRIVDFGNSSVGENTGPGGGGDGRDYLFYSAQEGGDVNRHVLVVREVDPLPDGSTLNNEVGVGAPTSTFGNEFHFVITWDEATGQLRLYENNVQVLSSISPVPFHEIHDVNVWLGRSQWSGDLNIQGDYNEFRIYDRILSPAEIAFNRTVGPDFDFGTPLAVRLVVPTNPMIEGRTQQAFVFADFNSVSNVDITFSHAFSILSGSPSVISVDGAGVLQANAAGSSSLTASFAGVSSDPVLVNVNTDGAKPTVVAVRGVRTLNAVTVQFDEEVGLSTAQNPANYVLTETNGTPVSIDSATLSPDGTKVTLAIPSHASGKVYNLAISGITDIAAVPNDINPTNITFQTWTIGLGSLQWDSFLNIVGGMFEFTNHVSFPDSPDQSNHVAAANSRLFYPTDVLEQYGVRFSGYFVPQFSANYTFYISSDDSSRLFLSTDSESTNKVLITEEPGCCAPFADRASASIPLVAGQHYYMEYLYKEGGGGDYGQIAVKRSNDPTPPNSLQPIRGALLASLADPVGASITITQQPVSVTMTQGMSVTLTVGVTTTNSYGDYNQIAYQWESRQGLGAWSPIQGANNASYAVPASSAGTTQYRVRVYIPGAQATSATATVLGLLAISWQEPGILQQAPEVTGPWTDIIGVTNPYIVDPTTAPRMFYRLKP
jgi:hypothetical protein